QSPANFWWYWKFQSAYYYESTDFRLSIFKAFRIQFTNYKSFSINFNDKQNVQFRSVEKLPFFWLFSIRKFIWKSSKWNFFGNGKSLRWSRRKSVGLWRRSFAEKR